MSCFIRCYAVYALLFLLAACTENPDVPTAGPEANEPPNVIIILTDDQGYGDLSSYGSPRITTPHLDRMAAEGLKFTSFCRAVQP